MKEAKNRRLGLVIFWIGTAYLFLMSWAIMWWMIPKYRFFPLEQTDGTIWAVGGAVFNLSFMAIPLGAPLMAVGLMLYAEQKKSSIWPIIVVCAFLILSGMFPSKLDYYPVVFGMLGGLQIVLFIAILWYWGKKRRLLEGPAKTAADYQLISYMFFLVAAATACVILGNPFFGLYFPEKVLESKAELMPMAYCTGIKLILYFTLGWFFAFLSNYKSAQEFVKKN
ncbi:MAG: hypothetical protein ACYTFW_14565 [Planctomycetota bacterium]|jgi:hypothetical protein